MARLKLIAKTLIAAKDASPAKELMKAVRGGDKPSRDALKKALTPLHAEIVNDFDKSVAAFFKSEIARLKKAYPDFSFNARKGSSRGYKRVGGNNQSDYGDNFEPMGMFQVHIK